MRRENLTVLIAEDSPGQRLLLGHAFRDCSMPLVLQMVTSGNEAIDYLAGAGQFADRRRFPYPTFVITDLDMPDGDGFAVLEFLRGRPNSAIIPTVVMSSLSDGATIRRAYELGASAYLEKPADYRGLAKLVQHLVCFWMDCEVPQVDHAGTRLYSASDSNKSFLGTNFQPKLEQV